MGVDMTPGKKPLPPAPGKTPLGPNVGGTGLPK